jgi:hypothetical protein
MDEIKVENLNTELNMDIVEERECLTDQEAKEFKKLFSKCMKSYKSKEIGVSDKKWLKNLFKEELPEITEDELETSSSEIVEAISEFDTNLASINKAIEQGVSKESWLADKFQESAVGMSVNEYGQTLQRMDDFLIQKNGEIHEALLRNSDGQIKMSRNLDGNIAENMIAKSTELSGFLQGKDIKVEVRDVFTSNSVDVRATHLKTGEYQNYQLKFGKDAKATIDLIKGGNYGNQRLVVATEQLKEVQAAFPTKTVTDHIDAYGAEGKVFTKEAVKEFQNLAQQDGIMPSMDYNHYQTKDLAMSIGKNAGVMALQSATISTGLNIAYRIAQGEKIDADEMVEIAITTGADTGLKVVTAGALQVAIRKGIISIIPKMTPAGVIANIACVGIENIKILNKIASGDLSITRGLDQMGRVTTSMVGGLLAMGKGALLGAKLTAWIPVVGVPLSIVSGFVGGMVGYFGGSKIGDGIYNAGKSVCSVAKSVASSAWNSVKSVGRCVASGLRSLFS